MVLSEILVNVTGKIYKVRLSCTKVQPITAFEWLVLNCTKRFERHPVISKKTLKEIMEEVLRIEHSEPLLVPTLEGLLDRKAILVGGSKRFDYQKLCLSDIRLTERGRLMLKDGVLAKEARNFDLDLAYNPLTGEILPWQENLEEDPAMQESLTLPAPGERGFPKDLFQAALKNQKTRYEGFDPAAFRVDDLKELGEKDQKLPMKLTITADQAGIISICPNLGERGEEGLLHLLPSLLLPEGMSEKVIESLPYRGDLPQEAILGTGRKALEQIQQEVNKASLLGQLLFLNQSFYNPSERKAPAQGEGGTLILFGPSGSTSKSPNAGLLYLGETAPWEGCALLWEDGGGITLCQELFEYGSQTITLPVALRESPQEEKKQHLATWLAACLQKSLPKGDTVPREIETWEDLLAFAKTQAAIYEATPRQEVLPIDALPIKALAKVDRAFDEKVLSYLQKNQIKTVGDFRLLTLDQARRFPAKSKTMIIKNTLLHLLQEKEAILSRVTL